MNIRYFIGVAAAAIVLTACHSKPSNEGGKTEVQTGKGSTANKETDNNESITVPDFKMPDTDGKEVTFLSEVAKNKITLVDFWASWCAPCRQEMPNIVKIYSEYKDKGLGIIGISLDEDRSEWLNAIKQMDMTWMQLSDLNGWENAAAQIYGVQGIPFTFLVDQNGKLLKAGLRGEELHKAIDQYLKE